MTITLTGDVPTEYRNDSLNQDIDATAATFHQRHGSTGDYPFNITGASAGNSGRLLLGGTMLGGVPTGDWRTLYEAPNGNSAAVRANNMPGVTIKGWHFKPDPNGNAVPIVGAPAGSLPRYVWDAIRTDGTTDNWIIEDIFLEGCRDDAMELENGSGGMIRNSRFFDCFVFLATDGASAGSKTIAIQNCLVSMGQHSYKGSITHQSPFKANKTASMNPRFVLEDVVIAIRDPNHEDGAGATNRMAAAFSRMTATNSYFLNLSDTPLPAAYPARPEGMATLQGQAARDYWDQRVAAWGQEEWMPTQAEWDALLARVTTAEGDIDTLKAGIASSGTADAALAARVTALEGATPDVTQAEMDALSERVTTLEAVQPAEVTQAELEALAERITAVEGTNTAQDAAITEAQSDADRVQDWAEDRSRPYTAD